MLCSIKATTKVLTAALTLVAPAASVTHHAVSDDLQVVSGVSFEVLAHTVNRHTQQGSRAVDAAAVILCCNLRQPLPSMHTGWKKVSKAYHHIRVCLEDLHIYTSPLPEPNHTPWHPYPIINRRA